ncbi:alpha/beta fold hydrolase [candidate division WWE3 bacterium]|uniref:Alpha/beta fold hydrolase n=1 Tax=candidate division WWE3 bacterium TaxID=2053526 RepID=A0A7X9DKQ5_UNCKA|nr:alpha/beta fold hydrolase [candidate division WWE3 bacterium]
MKDCKIIVVHGIGGSSKSNFFPCLKEIFDSLNLDYDISDYDLGLFNLIPNAKNWIIKLDEIIKTTDKPLVLVGYSLGARTVLMYLEEHNIQVEAVILISAPPNSPILGKVAKQGRVAGFFKKKLNSKNISSKTKRIIQVHSTDDWSIPYFLGKMLAEELESEFVTFNGRGHLADIQATVLLAPIILSTLN